MKTEQTIVEQPFSTEDMLFKCVNPDKVTYPDHWFTHPIPAFTSKFEIITPNSDGSRREWKPFQHYKSVLGNRSNSMELRVPTNTWALEPDVYWGTTRNPYASYVSYRQGGTLQPYGDAGRLNSGLPGLYVNQPDGGFIPPPSDLNTLVARSLKTMLPSIKAELSLPNSLYELKDFRSLPKQVKASLKELKKHVWLTNRPGSFTLRDLRNLSRETASGYLQWKFNLAPLLSDICGIYTALKRTERRIADLITRSGRVQNKHFMFTWTEFQDSYEDGYEEYGGFDEYYRLAGLDLFDTDRRVTYTPTTFHAQIQYNYNYTEFQLAHAQVLSLLDAVGVNLNPTIIWNAIPWTFVVDWVVSLGRFLDQFKLENMKPQINIRRFCWSVKRSRIILCTSGSARLNGGSKYGTPYNRITLPAVYESSYRRDITMPSMAAIQSSGLTLGEFTLGAALVLARKSKHRSPGQWRTLRR